MLFVIILIWSVSKMGSFLILYYCYSEFFVVSYLSLYIHIWCFAHSSHHLSVQLNAVILKSLTYGHEFTFPRFIFVPVVNNRKSDIGLHLPGSDFSTGTSGSCTTWGMSLGTSSVAISSATNTSNYYSLKLNEISLRWLFYL